MTDDIWAHIDPFETELGLRPGFLRGLRTSADDWSFVIKLHALFEAALAHCLCEELGRPELASVLAYTELSRDKAGKVEFGKAIGLLTKRERRFLRSLSEMRNMLVHEVRNTGFTFESHVAAMTAPQRSAFYDRFELDVEVDYVEIDGNRIPRQQFFLENPKLCLWVAALVLLEYLYQHKEITRLSRDLEGKYAAAFKRLREPSEGA